MLSLSNFDAVEERRIQDDMRKTILREKRLSYLNGFRQLSLVLFRKQ